jgi:hypothetical protein
MFQVKTLSNSYVLDGLEAASSYDLALAAVNSFGHSPFVSAKAETAARG